MSIRLFHSENIDTFANLETPVTCNHWPVGQAYCDGRVTQAADRPASFLGFPISNPVVHDVENGRSYVASLYGMRSSDMNELVEMARAWISAPKLTIDSESDYSGGEYAMDERSYKIKRTGKSSKLEFTLAGSEKSPIINPAIVVENWGAEKISIELNGKTLQANKDYSVGYDTRLEGTDLILWLKIQSHKKSNLSIETN